MLYEMIAVVCPSFLLPLQIHLTIPQVRPGNIAEVKEYLPTFVPSQLSQKRLPNTRTDADAPTLQHRPHSRLFNPLLWRRCPRHHKLGPLSPHKTREETPNETR